MSTWQVDTFIFLTLKILILMMKVGLLIKFSLEVSMKEPKVKLTTGEKEEICNLRGDWTKDRFEALKLESGTGEGYNLQVIDSKGFTKVVHIQQLSWADN